MISQADIVYVVPGLLRIRFPETLLHIVKDHAAAFKRTINHDVKLAILFRFDLFEQILHLFVILVIN